MSATGSSGPAEPAPRTPSSPSDRPLGASLGWRQLGSRHLFRSPWYDLRQDELRLPDQSQATYTYVEHPGFVSIVPLLPDGRVLLIRSYRYTVDRYVLEVPAGGFGFEPGDLKEPRLTAAASEDEGFRPRVSTTAEPEAVARRELLEETGFTADRFEAVGSYWSAIGNSRCRAHVYVALGARPSGEQRLEATEHIELLPTPLDEALAMARDGRIDDGHSALALLRSEARLREAASSAE